MTTTITQSGTTAANGSMPNVLGTGSSSFGDNPFLSLLVAEMRTQTPLQPVDNNSFMQQMSSFSSMTEQKQLNENLLKLLDFQGALARLQGLSQSSALLGKQVTYVGDDEGKKVETGVVDSVYVNEQGEVRLKIGETEIGLKQITGIAEAGNSGSES
jgi:flagellar basal-body rod modification protein FlgD